MLNYWDMVNRDIHALRCLSIPRDTFIRMVSDIESAVCKTVALVAGDREFPDDLRERTMGAIAANVMDLRWWDSGTPRHTIFEWNQNVFEWNRLAISRMLEDGYPPLLESLQQTFRELANRRIMTRFGVEFTADPSAFLAARDAAMATKDSDA